MSSTLDTFDTLLATGQQAVAVDAVMLARLTQIAGDFAVNLAIALIILVATVFAARWASSATRKALGRVRGFRHDPTVLSFAAQVVRVLVYLIGFIAVLQRLRLAGFAGAWRSGGLRGRQTAGLRAWAFPACPAPACL